MKLTKTWHKVLAVVLAAVLVLGLIPLAMLIPAKADSALYLVPGTEWDKDDAWFAAYFFGNGDTWVKMTDSDGDGRYECEQPSGYTNVIFVRMSSADTSTLSFNNAWNQTNDLTFDGNCYTITGWSGDRGVGTWSTITVEEEETTAPPETTAPDDSGDFDTEAGYIYFKPSSDWTVAGAKFMAYFFSGGEAVWVNCVDSNGDGIYEVAVPSGLAKVIFVRVNPDTEDDSDNSNNWLADHKWQQTADLTIPSDKNLFTLDSGTDDKIGGTWSAVGNVDSGSGSAEKVTLDDFYVNTDIVDYLNDNRVSSNNASSINQYSSNNQGNDSGAAFSKLNRVISSQNKFTAESTDSEYTIYLQPSTEWKADGARFAVYSWGSANEWDSMEQIGDTGIYSARISAGNTGVIFLRMNGSASTNDWANEWNRTPDLTVTGDNRLYTVTSGYGDKGTGNGLSGSWSTYGTADIKYTYPLYFGNLVLQENRYGLDSSDNKSSLTQWNSGANVALENGTDYSAVVQGLVYGNLVDKNGNFDPDGQLGDPVTKEQLIYFDKTNLLNWTSTVNGSDRVMAYYADLQFPFNAVYDPNTGATTYSYDSDADDAVFLNYDTKELYTDSTHALDNENKSGFYPLNKPGDSGAAANHGFGVKFTIDFTVSQEGLLSNGEPVTFNFTGDDDVWVFIDGYLVLDMGGAHKEATGSIDFKNLTATVQKAVSVDSSITQSASNYSATGVERMSGTGSQITTDFPTELQNFDYDEVHTLTMFYMERGGINSNMSIDFTISPIPSGLTVSKDFNNSEINPGILDDIGEKETFDFSFKTSNDSSDYVGVSKYSLIDSTGAATIVTLASAKKEFTLEGVREDKYAANFLNSSSIDAFLAGTNFKITELDVENSIFQYSGTSWKVYDLDSTDPTTYYKIVASGSGNYAEFSMGDDASKSYNYNLNFINTMKLGSLSVEKVYADQDVYNEDLSEGKWENEEFTFTILLDLDGEGTNFYSDTYEGIVYTLNDGTTGKTDASGDLTLKAGQTATITGIPAGATYQVVESVSANDFWTQYSAEKASGEIVSGETQAAVFKNITKSVSGDEKVIYVATNRNTNYTVKYNGTPLTSLAVSEETGITTTEKDGVVTVNAAEAGKKHYLTYSGINGKNEHVTGHLYVYTYQAEDHTYVFDFGLSSNLADTTSGDGLFQNGCYAIANDKATSKLTAINGSAGNTQTKIETTLNEEISETGGYASAVTFTPVKFMDQVESYTYTVQITADGKPFDANDPETGVEISGTITVMPANTVYYEEDFISEGFTATSTSEYKTLMQSNSQSMNYGFDPAYSTGLQFSNGKYITLTNGNTLTFTFKGTAFDIISTTTTTSAGLKVEVFDGSTVTDTALKTIFVDTHYTHGSLYQIPVISADMNTYGEYTVKVTALSTFTSTDKTVTTTNDTVEIDGIRIYQPIATAPDAYLANEKDATVTELREKLIVGSSAYTDNDKRELVTTDNQNGGFTRVEDPDGSNPVDVNVAETIYTSGPNNEIYLGNGYGVRLWVNVTDRNAAWTLQIGAKSVGQLRPLAVLAYNNSTGEYDTVLTDGLSTSTDMYYDLTDVLTEDHFDSSGNCQLVIINNSSDNSQGDYEFISLTTVKYNGLTLGKKAN